MKKFILLLLMAITLSGYSQKVTNTWDGSDNSYWHNANNWSLNHIPTSTEDVVIPNGMPRYPNVASVNEEINTLYIASDAYVNVWGCMLKVNNDVDVFGEIKMKHTDAELYCNNIFWESGSEAETTGDCIFRVWKTWAFRSGANVHLDHGSVYFVGGENSYIRSKEAGCYFNNINVNKFDNKFGISALSNATCRIKGDMTFGGINYFFASYSSQTVQIGGDFINASADVQISLEKGSVEFTGNGSDCMLRPQEGDFFHNLIVNTGSYDLDMSSVYATSFEIKNNVIINSGRFDVNAMDLIVGGNWENFVGSYGFWERNKKVTFNGIENQYCSDEAFYTLEVDKGAGALQMDGTDVVCQHYDWTAGTVEVLSGSFTANELLDNAIQGIFYVNTGGTINLHNNDGFIDLKGDLYILGGNFNVYGGMMPSYWPYMENASITMSGGVLDFKDRGINIANSSYTLNNNITGGRIRCVGYLYNSRADFSPNAGIFEMYGSSNSNIRTENGGRFYKLSINKTADKDSREIKPFTDRDGTFYDGSRGTTVQAISDIEISYDLYIDSGIFWLNGHDFTTDYSAIIYGTLKMNDASENFTARGSVFWSTGSTADVTAGNIYVHRHWYFENGTTAQLGAGNTVHFNGFDNQYIFCYDADAEFNNVIIYHTDSSVWLHGSSTQQMHVAGNMTVNNGGYFHIQNNDLLVDGTLDIKDGGKMSTGPDGLLTNNSDFGLNGELYVGEGDVMIHGTFDLEATGELTIDGGNFSYDEGTGYCNIFGILNLSGGMFETSECLNIKSSADVNVSGGTIRAPCIVANIANTFQPSAGVFECQTDNNAHGSLQLHATNYFHDLKINPATGIGGGTASSDLHITHNLIISAGDLNLEEYTVTVDNDVIIYGKLKMTDPAGVLKCNNRITWEAGSDDIITDGNIYTKYWIFKDGTNAQLGTGNTTHIKSGINTYDPDAEFGNLIIGSWEKSESSVDDLKLLTGTDGLCTDCCMSSGLVAPSFKTTETGGKTYYPRRVAGYCTYLSGAGWSSTVDIIIQGTLDIQEGALQTLGGTNTISTYSYFLLNGKLNLSISGNGHAYAGFDLNTTGELSIGGGEFIVEGNDPNIYGTLNMSDGVFDTDQQLGVASSSLNITGGTIRVGSNFNVDPGTGSFTPSGGTVEFNGNETSTILLNNTDYFHDLTVNKTAAKTATWAIFSNDATIQGETTVNSGNLGLDNHTVVNFYGDVNVNSGCTFFILYEGSVKFNDSVSFNINSGGKFQSISSSYSHEATVSSPSGYYYFNVNSGATVSAYWTIFENMRTGGLNIKPGAIIDTEHPLAHCSFQNGSPGSTLMTIDNDQEITINSATFNTNGTENYNVTKNEDAGNVTFTNFGGDFYGPDHEKDPFGRIQWFVPELSVSPSVQNVSAEAGTTTFTVTANVDWTVTDSADWISVSPTSGSNNGTLTVTYDENTALTPRSGIISVMGFDVDVVTVTVTQDGAGLELTVDPENRDVSAEAGTTTFHVYSNTAWTVTESVDWLSVSPMSGSGDGTLTVNYNENTFVEERVGSITVETSAKVSVTVTVTQAGADPELTVDPENRDVSAEAGTTTFHVYSNTAWTVTESVDWLSVSPMSGSGDGMLTVNYDENTSVVERIGSITIETSAKVSVTVTVTQDGATEELTVDPENRDVSAEAGTTTFHVYSNTDWTVTEGNDWLSVSPMSGSGDATLTVNYNENTFVEERVGSITVETSAKVSVTVTVTQAGADPELTVDPDNRDVLADAGTTTFNVFSNTDWTVTEGNDWLSVSPMNGSGDATLTVDYDENNSVEQRIGEITIETSAKMSVTVTVTQEGTETTLAVTPPIRMVGPPAGTTTFDIVSNTEWTVSESYPWFTVDPMSGSGDGLITVNYDENTSGFGRVGGLTVTAAGGSPSVTVHLSQGSFQNNYVSIPAGWSGLSSYVMPADNDIENVFSDVVDDLVILQTMEGVYYPFYNVNTIGTWEHKAAFRVKFDAPVDLQITGTMESDLEVDLEAQWQLLPVLSPAPKDVEELFSPVVSDLVIVKDIAGAGVYWPEKNINTLIALNSDEAYYVLMSAPATVTYSNPANDSFAGHKAEVKPNPEWNTVEQTPATHVIALGKEAIDHFEPGDYIGVFTPQGHCAGQMQITGSAQHGVLVAFGNDPYGGSGTGFASGEQMLFKYFKTSTGQAFDLLPVYDLTLPDANGLFAENGISAITGFKVSGTGIPENDLAAISLFPNPTSGAFTIRGIDENTEIVIYNMQGQVVETDMNQSGTEITLVPVVHEAGIYMVKIITGKNTIFRKLVMK